VDQLLATKFYIPTTRTELVARPRLIERMNEGLLSGRKLTLISAPAGFGKTTLVSEWLEKIRLAAAKERQSNYRIAWLSLDESDNDPVSFLYYFISALNRVNGFDNMIGNGAVGMLESPQPPPTEAILTSLINDVVALPDKIIFVLDDYHSIESASVDDVLAFFLAHLPTQLHLVIATRVDPQLALARLRARGHLTELRAADLRFTSSEAAAFLNRVMGLDLSAEDIAALETRTEGWIAGLQLAAISMQGHQDTSGLIKSFTGSHRYVLDYLIEEVLEQQSEAIQKFLQQTAVLNRMTGPLCDALTGQNDGQETLELLDRANLFIIPLDNERRWYRYHHLFAELLKQRLKITHPNWIKDLHSKAVIWYEMNGNLSEAIHHAFACNDTKTATRLIEKGALEALERSEFGFIFNAVDRLPENALQTSPWLFVYYTWALILTGQVEVTASKLENTDWLLDFIPDDDENNKRKMLGYIAGLKAHLAGWQRDYPNMVDYANQAIVNLPENHWICGYCDMAMGVAFWGNGNLKAARDAFIAASSVGKISGNKRVAVTSAGYLGFSLELEGCLRQAVALLQDSFQLAEHDGRKLPLAGYLHIDLARVLYEWNEVDLASQHLKEGIKLCQRLSDGRVEKIGHCLLARVYLAQEDLVNVINSIQKADQAHPGTETEVDMRGGEYPRVWLWLKQNDFVEIEAWLRESDLDLKNVTHFKTKLIYTMHARASIALGRVQPRGTYLHDALVLLDELLGLAESNGWGNKRIEILVLQALALDADGDTARAMTSLEKALHLAKPEGYIRTFVDEGLPMARLLYKALSCGIAPDYSCRLLAAFPSAEQEQTNTSWAPALETELIEPLSERETEILQCIARGLTNQEIASRLYLSLNTVKVHTRNIYGKLSVNSRTQAVARARAVGILTFI
jgi:LuxR family maltose regulon positive regulatory protein